ncbi:Lactate dehydrogenase [Ruminococcaceae bacterium D5]|nr:Lactate dehydrogenase [Ruminococcaceae bacterium D5]
MQQKKVKILVEGTRARYEKFLPQDAPLDRVELAFCGRGSSNAELLAAGGDAQILCVDAISPVDAALIAKMPNLRLIHSEGVAFNCIDLAAAKKRGIYVCNCKGCNADAVAEQTVMLVLELLRHGLTGDAAVRAGRQMEMKERLMVEGITELGECSVGLIGFGDIAKAAAARLHPFGCELFYYAPHRKDPETELEYHVAYLELEELAARCDIVSIHTAVTEQTRGMINRDFLARMKPNALLINTARGEIVDNLALRKALSEGRILGAGLDTLAPEPTPADHPLVDLPEGVRDRVVLAPHLGGITTGSFRRAHRSMWGNIAAVLDGSRPVNIVNGL